MKLPVMWVERNTRVQLMVTGVMFLLLSTPKKKGQIQVQDNLGLCMPINSSPQAPAIVQATSSAVLVPPIPTSHILHEGVRRSRRWMRRRRSNTRTRLGQLRHHQPCN